MAAYSSTVSHDSSSDSWSIACSSSDVSAFSLAFLKISLAGQWTCVTALAGKPASRIAVAMSMLRLSFVSSAAAAASVRLCVWPLLAVRLLSVENVGRSCESLEHGVQRIDEFHDYVVAHLQVRGVPIWVDMKVGAIFHLRGENRC